MHIASYSSAGRRSALADKFHLGGSAIEIVRDNIRQKESLSLSLVFPPNERNQADKSQ